MKNTLYRIDSGLLTIVEVGQDKIYEDTPLNYWLPAWGDGEVMYCTSHDDAKRILHGVVCAKIAELEEIKAGLGE